MGKLVPRTATPLTEQGIADALLVGHRRVLGEPSRERSAVAWAHIALENDRGNGIFNYNFGNITLAHTSNGDYDEIVTEEQLKPGVWTPTEMRFCAFDTAEDGAEAYWLLFVDGLGRYASALPFYDKGDAYGAAYKLHDLRYFTANVEPYATAMRSLCAEWLGKTRQAVRQSPP